MLPTSGWRPSAGSGEAEKEPKIQNWKLIWSLEEFSLLDSGQFLFSVKQTETAPTFIFSPPVFLRR